MPIWSGDVDPPEHHGEHDETHGEPGRDGVGEERYNPDQQEEARVDPCLELTSLIGGIAVVQKGWTPASVHVGDSRRIPTMESTLTVIATATMASLMLIRRSKARPVLIPALTSTCFCSRSLNASDSMSEF